MHATFVSAFIISPEYLVAFCDTAFCDTAVFIQEASLFRLIVFLQASGGVHREVTFIPSLRLDALCLSLLLPGSARLDLVRKFGSFDF